MLVLVLISCDPSKAFPSSLLPLHATPYSIYQACSEYTSRHDEEVQHLVLDHILVRREEPKRIGSGALTGATQTQGRLNHS